MVTNTNLFRYLKEKLDNEILNFNKEGLLNKTKTSIFSNNILYHSKLFAYNPTPFYMEHRGYGLDKLKKGPPKKRKDCYIYYGDENISKIEDYNNNEKLVCADYIIDSNEIREVISVDNFFDVVKYNKVISKDNIPVEEYEILDRENASATFFIYNENRITNSLDVKISLNLCLYCENIYQYNDEGILQSIYSKVGDKGGYLYKKKQPKVKKT